MSFVKLLKLSPWSMHDHRSMHNYLQNLLWKQILICLFVDDFYFGLGNLLLYLDLLYRIIWIMWRININFFPEKLLCLQLPLTFLHLFKSSIFYFQHEVSRKCGCIITLNNFYHLKVQKLFTMARYYCLLFLDINTGHICIDYISRLCE